MDWDDEVFSREEILDNLRDLGIPIGSEELPELLKRTTKNTRRGTEFGFKPIELAIGTVRDTQFYEGRRFSVDKSGENIHTKKMCPSSFWIRLFEQWFQIRAFCSESTSLTFRPYECRIPFRDVISIQLRAQYPWGPEERVLIHLLIRSRRPPSYTHYLRKVLMAGNQPVYDRHATEADFFDPPELESEAGPIYAVGDHRSSIYPGLWLTHRVTLTTTIRQYKLLWMCMTRLRLIHLDVDIIPPSTPLSTTPMSMWPQSILNNLDFKSRYLVEGLLSHGTIDIEDVTTLIHSLATYRTPFHLGILEGLFRWTRSKSLQNDVKDVARRMSITTKLPSHLVPIRRCRITPTRCLLYPPVPETSSALLRAHTDYLDRFLRVQFVDDDGDFPVSGETLLIDRKLHGTEGVFARIRRTLYSGVEIAGRSYTFLTFGESQIRERGCWMISESGSFTVANILAWMGDLSQERIVAKHAARQGLVLSTTRELEGPLKITIIQDISHISNGHRYTYTDGVGKCAQSLIDRIARSLDHREAASAVQGRIGGVKGVFCAVDSTEEIGFDQNEVRVRPSQTKFPSGHKLLSVVKIASYSRATLNRQAILLLEALGVSTDILLQIFRDEKTKIENFEDRFDATRLSIVSTFPIADARKASITEDPLMENIIRLNKCRLLSDLKWKAWIEIPESAFLMGVADETGSLEEGQIFCQLNPPWDPPQVVTGPCMIYRNPCLHPGDIRLVNAVDSSRLRHLKNVIVFSTRGSRDLPNMLAGGDLDGDHYSLLWDKRLQVPESNMYPPMDYTAPESYRCPVPVTIDQTKEHVVDFICNDCLGRICNAHMALADKYGPYEDECIKLAGLASKAVDFAKTGVPVSQADIPVIEEYPDYMGKDFKSVRVFKKQVINSYESQKALGQMFREIDPEPKFEEVTDMNGDPRLLALELPESYRCYLEPVALFKARYDFQLTGLSRRYNITEVECVAGVLLRVPRARFSVKKDFDLRVAVREAFQTLATSAVESAKLYVEQNPVTGLAVDRQAWALAAYKITHSSDRAKYGKADWSIIDLELTEAEELDLLDELFDTTAEEKRLLSYPWLFFEELCTLVQ